MCYSNPELLDALLSHLADQMASYIKYQIESGAQCVQVREDHRGRESGEGSEGKGRGFNFWFSVCPVSLSS